MPKMHRFSEWMDSKEPLLPVSQDDTDFEKPEKPVPLSKKIGAALFYGCMSVVVVFSNKILLTNYKFPSFVCVAVLQMVATIVILFTGKCIGIVKFPDFDDSIPGKIMPVPILYGLNLVAGLGGTKLLNLPMYTVLRRFSIFFTMILEYYILGVRSSCSVRFAVFFMILGSFIAGAADLTYDLLGYCLILLADLATASLGVYTKQKLDAKELGKYGLMFYNCLLMLIPTLILAIVTEEYDKGISFMFSEEMTVEVWTCLMLSLVCGFVLNFANVLCTQCNSALTTTCVGPIKNIIVTYGGMFSSGDYIFEVTNFVGINISVVGSIIYTYVTFAKKRGK